MMLFYVAFLIISLYFLLNKNNALLKSNKKLGSNYKISVIIPARNEEKNIEKILNSIRNQTLKVHEIIVVDDASEDNTAKVVEKFQEVKLIQLEDSPKQGWNGKSWAIWNGYLNSSGELLLFVDADVELEREAIETLVEKFNKYKGLISVWPYQRFEKFHEHFTLVFNLVIIYMSNLIGTFSKKPKGAFGPVILTSRKDYEYVGGHKAIRDSVLDDIKLGKLYSKSNINVKNFLGGRYIKFRMYPQNLRQLYEGFSKNMASGSISGGFFNLIIAILWTFGIFSALFTFDRYFVYRYFSVVVFLYLLSKNLGDYKWYDYIFFPIHLLFFTVTFFNSLYRKLFLHSVVWKGRKINV